MGPKEEKELSPEVINADFIGQASNVKALEKQAAEAKAELVKTLWAKRNELDRALEALGEDPKRRPGRPRASRSKKLPLAEVPA
jgi:hypothetical protein